MHRHCRPIIRFGVVYARGYDLFRYVQSIGYDYGGYEMKREDMLYLLRDEAALDVFKMMSDDDLNFFINSILIERLAGVKNEKL